MSNQKFSKSEAVSFGWNTVKTNLWFFVGVLITIGLIAFALVIIEILVKNNSILLFLFHIIYWILSIVISMGLNKISLRFCDKEKGKFSDIFLCFPLFFKYLFASILYGMIIFGGTILLIIPGIIWAIKFQFFKYFIVDRNLGPIEALKKSALITRGAKWDLFLFSLLCALINLAGFICLLIGLFITIPLTMVADAFVYRRLLAQTEKT